MRFLHTFDRLWPTAAINHVKEGFNWWCSRLSKGLLSIPYLPQHYPQAVDVCSFVVRCCAEHFRCHVFRASSNGASNVFCCFWYANICHLHWVSLWKLRKEKPGLRWNDTDFTHTFFTKELFGSMGERLGKLILIRWRLQRRKGPRGLKRTCPWELFNFFRLSSDTIRQKGFSSPLKGRGGGGGWGGGGHRGPPGRRKQKNTGLNRLIWVDRARHRYSALILKNNLVAFWRNHFGFAFSGVVVGQASISFHSTPTSLIATYENHSYKRPLWQSLYFCILDFDCIRIDFHFKLWSIFYYLIVHFICSLSFRSCILLLYIV